MTAIGQPGHNLWGNLSPGLAGRPRCPEARGGSALDYIMYEEMNKQSQGNRNKPGKTGCLGVVTLVVLPATVIGYIVLNIA